MVDQPAPIIIQYWEGDETKDTPFTHITYIEWMEGRKSYYAHADESMFNLGEENGDLDEQQDGRGNWEHRGIPPHVLRTLANLIYPPKDYSRDDAEYNVTCPHCGTKLGVN